MGSSGIRKSGGWAVLVALALAVSSLPSSTVDAQQGAGSEGTEATVSETFRESSVTSADERPTPFTKAEIAELDARSHETHLPGPKVRVSSAPVVGPEPGTESVATSSTSDDAPQANGTFTIFRRRNIGTIVTTGKSDVAEVSVAGAGRYLFATWNWGAARSRNGGATWTYVDPTDGFPDLCCDQVVQYDPGRDLLIWLRQSIRSGNLATDTNQYRISASTDGGATWRNWNLTSPAGEWFDYPHIGLTNDFMYVSYNKYTTAATPVWISTQVRRIPLDTLRDGGSLSTSTHTDTVRFTATPVQGASDTMFWATHDSTTTLRIREWSDDSTTVNWFDRTIPAWTQTNRGDMSCAASGDDWAARGGDRVLSGVRADGTLTWFWNVQAGSGFPLPYTNAATFDEATKDYLSRPLIWSSSTCFLYAAVHVNSRGHIGLVVNEGTDLPDLYVGLADDYSGAPPPWDIHKVWSSTERPPNEWGDYNTVRPNYPGGVNFIGSGHTRTTTTDDRTQIWFVVFGRERDRNSWFRWVGK